MNFSVNEFLRKLNINYSIFDPGHTCHPVKEENSNIVNMLKKQTNKMRGLKDECFLKVQTKFLPNQPYRTYGAYINNYFVFFLFKLSTFMKPLMTMLAF